MLELLTAPKLRIRPRRVAVMLTTRVTGDLRLLRILVIDQSCDGGGFELLRRIGCGRPGSGRRRRITGGAVSSVRAQSRRPESLSEAVRRTAASATQAPRQGRTINLVSIGELRKADRIASEGNRDMTDDELQASASRASSYSVRPQRNPDRAKPTPSNTAATSSAGREPILHR